MLVRIVKNWTEPDLLRQTPDYKGIWNDIRFTLDPVDECDVLLVLNDLREDISVRCPPENVWAIFQEPYLPSFMPWMKEGHGQFARVYTSCPPDAHPRYRISHPLVPWHVGKSYDELSGKDLPPKNDRIVWITSALQVLPGHVKRHGFYRFLLEAGWPDLDVWGRGIRPIVDKWDALVHSRYALAVENHSGNNYWTEKIADCWLTETLPFYYGCPNLEDYFPADSFVRIDIHDPRTASRIIRQTVNSGEYEKRLPAIRKARDLVLNQYQFFPFLVNELRNYPRKTVSAPVHLAHFSQSSFSRLFNHCCQVLHLLKVRNLS